MFKKYSIVFLFLILALSLATPSSAFWWMGYHKPAFNGRVIDAETKEPIEGAVVVVSYYKKIITGPESNSIVMDVRETLTDKNGDFHIPSYTTIVQPLSWEGLVTFIIYKPGYGSFPSWRVSPPKDMSWPELEDFFSKGEVGSVGEVRWHMERHEVTFGVVELPRLKTREERGKSMSYVFPSADEFLEEEPNLIRLINEEEENLGLQKSDPYKAREFKRRMRQ